MKPIYTEIETPSGQIIIRAEYPNGIVHIIPADSENSDYAQYLASLEATEPEAE
jgi:hypothetical protein